MNTNQPLAVKAQLALRIGKSNRVIAVETFDDASDLWHNKLRGDRSGRSCPRVSIINVDTGAEVATISFNGRVWDMNGDEIRTHGSKTAAEHDAEGWKDFIK